MYDIVLSFITAFLMTYFAIPHIIRIAKEKGIYDEPGGRKMHEERTPSLGGIAIFGGMIFSIILWTPFEAFGDLQYILSAFILIFLVGAWDDIAPISPTNKLIAQLLAAAILVFKANVRIGSFYGIFGVETLPYWASVGFTAFTIIVIINAFNLIDGINGLSGSITLLVAVLLGVWFYLQDRMELVTTSFALAGAVIAFLKFNFTPAKIFMGDTGALLCGLVCAILTIEFIDQHRELTSPYAFKAVPAVAIGILILPLFDTLRVFVMRILKGRSPLHPDRSHIHHLLIDAGFNHSQATGVLVLANLIFIFVAMRFQSIGTLNLILIIGGMAFLMSLGLSYYSGRKRSLNR